ncbi:MAG TPA: porin family protein [Mangrovimonas sp.]|nr:porin family protein [Mangrovimonas sp.]
MDYIKKSKLFLSLSFVCLVAAIQAQEFKFGAKAGMNISSISFKDSDYSTKPVIGVQVGAIANYSFNDKIAVQPEVLFLTGGNKWRYENGTDGRIKTSYISIPVLVQYNIIEGLYAEAGPQYNFLLSIKQSIGDSDFDDIKELYKSGTFGFAVGVGYDLGFLLPGLKAGARYTRDLSKMNDQEVGAIDLKASMIQIGVSYTFTK